MKPNLGLYESALLLVSLFLLSAGLFKHFAFGRVDFDKLYFSIKLSISSTKQGQFLEFTKFYKLSVTCSPFYQRVLYIFYPEKLRHV